MIYKVRVMWPGKDFEQWTLSRECKPNILFLHPFALTKKWDQLLSWSPWKCCDAASSIPKGRVSICYKQASTRTTYPPLFWRLSLVPQPQLIISALREPGFMTTQSSWPVRCVLVWGARAFRGRQLYRAATLSTDSSLLSVGGRRQGNPSLPGCRPVMCQEI